MSINKEFQLNLQIMQEMGLEEGEKRRVIDQDTGMVCTMGSKEIVTPGSQSGKNSIEFDVVNNPRLMSKMFSEFVDKLSEEGEIESCISFESFENKKDGTMTAKMMFMSGDSLQSKPYKNESLCYIDLVHRLNGEDNPDFSEYDNSKGKKRNGNNSKANTTSNIKKKTAGRKKT